MKKISKQKRKDILQERFPEFFKLSQEFGEAICAVIDEMQEQLDKLEEIESLQEELEDRKREAL